MIPFPILNNTRITPSTTIRYFTQSSAGEVIFCIDSMNRLWGWGLNDWGQLGTGDRTNRYGEEFTLIRSNVKRVWCGRQATFCQDMNGDVSMVGNRRVYGLSNDPQLTWRRDDFFSQRAIKKMSISLDFFMVLSGEELWATGKNVAGVMDGNRYVAIEAVAKNYLLLSIGIKDFSVSGDTTTYIQYTNGGLSICGYNILQMIDSKVPATNFLSFTEAIPRNTHGNNITHTYGYKYSFASGSTEGRGSGTAYKFGNNSPANLIALTNLDAYWKVQPSQTKNVYRSIGSDSPAYTVYLGTDGKVYGAGSQSSGQMGVGNKDEIRIISELPVPSFSINDFICFDNNPTACWVVLKNKVYFSGTISTINKASPTTPLQLNTTTFTEYTSFPFPLNLDAI